MNRGAAVSIGDTIYAIETLYEYPTESFSMVKLFPSETGFKAGLRAVEWDVSRPDGPVGYRTYIMPQPTWMLLTEQ